VLCVLDDSVVIRNGEFSWNEDDTSVLKELVFSDFFCHGIMLSTISV